jgi:hypothetical protein
MLSFHPFLLFQQNCILQKNHRCKPFQIVGIDILVDRQLKPWLIEINGSPSMDIMHQPDILNPDQPKVVNKVDLFIKRQVVEGAIKIMQLPVSEQRKIVDKHGYEQLPMEETSISENMTMFSDIIKIFQHLSGERQKVRLPLSKFRKLSELQGMKDKRFLKQDYDILYRRIEVTSASGQMDFYGFINAIEQIAKRLNP